MKITYYTILVQVAEPTSLTDALNGTVAEGWKLVQILYMNNIHVLCIFSRDITEEQAVDEVQSGVSEIKDLVDEAKGKV